MLGTEAESVFVIMASVAVGFAISFFGIAVASL